jgi:hypothetical protein
VAVNLAPVLGTFKSRMSYDTVDVTVDAPDRQYAKRCALQEGLSSLVGLIMPTSGCPILDKLRPMAASHLPFSSTRETIHRALASYVLAQFVRLRRQQPADWQLKNLTRTYEDIRIVNEAFAARVRDLPSEDAGINAVVRLDAFADMITFTLANDWWRDLESLFEPLNATQNTQSPCKATSVQS